MEKKVKLGFLVFFSLLSFMVKAQIGVGTLTPQKTLHVNGDLQVTNELNVGGDATTTGTAGVSGQILSSNGPGNAPSWQTPNRVAGTIASAHYVQGTRPMTVRSLCTSDLLCDPKVTVNTADVPGLSMTLTVPAGITQTFLFTVTGYAVSVTTTSDVATQGVFSLLQDGVKISSAFTSSGDGGSLNNLPSPCTFLKSVTLNSGTYTFKVQYTAWSGDQVVNYVPTAYKGYNGDTEAMLTKMQILVYND